MEGAETPVERLRKFLRELSPGVRSLLVGELERSVNEMTKCALTELRQYPDNGKHALLEALRHAGETDRAFRQSQVDAQYVSAPKYSGANMPLCWGKLQRSPQPQSARPSAPETRRFSPHAISLILGIAAMIGRDVCPDRPGWAGQAK